MQSEFDPDSVQSLAQPTPLIRERRESRFRINDASPIDVVDRGIRRQIDQNVTVILFTVVVLSTVGLFLLFRTLHIVRRHFVASAIDNQ